MRFIKSEYIATLSLLNIIKEKHPEVHEGLEAKASKLGKENLQNLFKNYKSSKSKAWEYYIINKNYENKTHEMLRLHNKKVPEISRWMDGFPPKGMVIPEKAELEFGLIRLTDLMVDFFRVVRNSKLRFGAPATFNDVHEILVVSKKEAEKVLEFATENKFIEKSGDGKYQILDLGFAMYSLYYNNLSALSKSFRTH